MAASTYARYLAAKKTVDDRALNAVVLQFLQRELAARAGSRLRVLEIGAGLGTMPARLIERSLIVDADYTLLDQDAGLLEESRTWLERWATGAGLRADAQSDGLRLSDGGSRSIAIRTRAAELGEFLREACGPYDLVIANAVLDLVDVPAILPRLLALLSDQGLYWFSINYDGETVLLPELPEDAQFLAAYHHSMDTRRRDGRVAGDSRTGRHLFTHLRDAGAQIASAGSSDWVVFAPDGRYPHDEAEFLAQIVRTIDEELQADASIDPRALAEWVAKRRAQLERAELVYIAHQLDFVGRCA